MVRTHKSAIGWTSSGYHDPKRGKKRHDITIEIADEYAAHSDSKAKLNFAQRVENLFEFYDTFRSQAAEPGPSPATIRKEFKEICDTARRLKKMLSRLSDPAQGIIHGLKLQAEDCSAERSPGKIIDDAIRIITELQPWTDLAHSMASQAVGKGLKSQPETNERDLAHGLIAAFVKLTGEIPKMGWDAMTVPGAIREDGNQKFDGPFHRFVSDVFAKYGINLTPDIIAGYIRTYLIPPSP